MSTGHRVLIIDDDETIRKTLSLILDQHGYVVDTAANGIEAIAKTRSKFYNLALVDVRLPDVDCQKLLKLLYEATPRMTKVILTGYPLSEDALQAITQGVDGFLAKPVEPNRLLQTISQLLEKQPKEPSLTLLDS
jgi:DNA-binding NtrC family response regulator